MARLDHLFHSENNDEPYPIRGSFSDVPNTAYVISRCSLSATGEEEPE